MPKILPDTEKDCGEPGCPNDDRSQCSPVATRSTLRNLVQQFRLGHRLPDLYATVGAFIGEVDRRRAPMWRDVLDVHRQARTAWAGHEGWFGIVMVDIGWHLGSPQQRIQLSSPTPKLEGAPQRLMER